MAIKSAEISQLTSLEIASSVLAAGSQSFGFEITTRTGLQCPDTTAIIVARVVCQLGALRYGL